MNPIMSIEACFEGISRSGGRIRECIRELDRITSEGLAEHEDNTRRIWKEKSSDIYLQKMTALMKELVYETGTMQETLDDIDNAARVLLNAELVNQSLAIIRKYK